MKNCAERSGGEVDSVLDLPFFDEENGWQQVMDIVKEGRKEGKGDLEIFKTILEGIPESNTSINK